MEKVLGDTPDSYERLCASSNEEITWRVASIGQELCRSPNCGAEGSLRGI